MGRYEMNSESWFFKSIAKSLCISLVFLPIHSYVFASDLSGVGKDAGSFGQSLATSFQNGSANSGTNGNIILPNNAGQIDVNQLYPGTSGSGNKSSSDYFSGGVKPDTTQLGQLSDNGDQMDTDGSNTKQSLFSDATSNNPSIPGAAYKVLLDASNRSRPDFSSDPMLNSSRNVYKNIDVIASGFGDCTTQTKINNGTKLVHMPDYKQCDRVKKMDTCTVERTLIPTVDTFTVFSFSGNVDHVLKLTFQVATDKKLSWTGSGKNPYLSDSLKSLGGYYEELEETNHGDLDATITINTIDKTSLTKSSKGTPVRFKFQQNWKGSVQSVTVSQEPSQDNNWTAVVYIYTPASGEQNVDMSLDMSITYINDKVTGGPCSQSSDEFCQAKPFVCSDNAVRTINGVTLDDAVKPYVQPLAQGDTGPICYSGHVDYSCGFNEGQMQCWTDMQGVQHCPVNDSSNLNSCSELEKNTQCGYIKSDCVEGAKSSTGTCYVQEDTYDCGTDVSVPNISGETTYSCQGEIKCMGTDCLDVNQTHSQDFGKAAALLNTLQFMSQDMTCDTSKGVDTPDCKVFSGKPGECKIAVGGAQNCCESPSVPSIVDYMTFVMAVPKLDAAMMNTGTLGPTAVQSAYQTLRDPIVNNWNTLTKPLTNFMDTLGGTTSPISTTVTDLSTKVTDALAEQLQKLSEQLFGKVAEQGGTQAAASGSAKATDALMKSPAGQLMGNIMLAYTIYSMTMLAIQIIWQCEQSELELTVHRDLKNCHYVGSYCKTEVLGVCVEKRKSYCCFSSPLSRIIQEQIRPLLGKSWGDTESPTCEGISISEINQIDWDKINLDEWLGLLKISGQFPDPSKLNMETITGSGSTYNINFEGNGRANSTDRAEKRLDGIDIDQLRKDGTTGTKLDTGAH